MRPEHKRMRVDIPPPAEEGWFKYRFTEPGAQDPHSELVCVMREPKSGELRVVRRMKDPPFTYLDGSFKHEEFLGVKWRRVREGAPLYNPDYVSWKGSVAQIIRNADGSTFTRKVDDVKRFRTAKFAFTGETGRRVRRNEWGYAEGAIVKGKRVEDTAGRSTRISKYDAVADSGDDE